MSALHRFGIVFLRSALVWCHFATLFQVRKSRLVAERILCDATFFKLGECDVNWLEDISFRHRESRVEVGLRESLASLGEMEQSPVGERAGLAGTQVQRLAQQDLCPQQLTGQGSCHGRVDQQLDAPHVRQVVPTVGREHGRRDGEHVRGPVLARALL